MSRTRVFRLLVPALVLGFFAFEANAAQAQTGTITGRVAEQGTSRPLAGAQVFVAGTSAGTLTNSNGVYRLGDLEPGQHEVTALLIGFAPETETVTVRAGETTNVDFMLSTTAISLDAIVATATGEQRKRELANAASSIEAEDIVRTRPVTSMADLLQARAPNVQVLQSSGTTGGGARIRIRGSNSVSLSNEPLIYVDGVRINNDTEAFSIGVGGQDPSSLNNLNPEEIESIEIVKGPSAATLYGTDAANGVIRITTKRGRGGPPRWNFYVEGGLITDKTDYPLNRLGLAGDGSACFAFQVGLGACSQSSIQAFQPLSDDQFSPIGQGDRRQFGGSVSGGTDRINYFISAEYEAENGYLELPEFYENQIAEEGSEVFEWQDRPNDLDRIALRANLGSEVAQGLRLDLSTGYVSSDLRLPQNDNNSLGMIPSGILGRTSSEVRDGWGFYTPREVFAIESLQETERFTGSAQANFQPNFASWLTARAAIGLDISNRHDSQFVPVGEVPAGSLIEGDRTSNRVEVRSETVDVGANATFDVTEDVRSRTSVGLQYFRDFLGRTEANGSQLAPGTKSVGAAALVTAAEQTAETITLGTFIEEQISWRDRVFVTGAIRFDDNSAFGQDLDLITYPKLGASVVVIDDTGDPLGGVLNSLRLRGAWGASGVAPGSTDALQFFDPIVASVAGNSVPAVSIGELGNQELKPERSEEIEVGFDANLWDGRLGVELTYFHKETEDALIDRRLAPSLGLLRDLDSSSDRFENIGSVKNTGWELALNATVLNLDDLLFEVNASGSLTDNELLELGEGVDDIIFGNQRHVEGFPLGGYWDRKLEFSDADGNGIITPDELTLGDEVEFLGNVFPEVEASINAAITAFDVVRLAALFDHRGDFLNYNFSEEFRCRFAICQGLNDPNAPLFEQARALNTVIFGGRRTGDPYLEDASFWKLRELSLTFFLPDSWVSSFGGSSANLTFTGRNLVTWTDYTGFDPEINQVGQNNFTQREFLTLAPAKTWIARLNVGF